MSAAREGAPADAVDAAASALLGALLWDPARVDDVSAWLAPEDLRRTEHRAIFRTLATLRRAGEAIDVQTLPHLLVAQAHQQDHRFSSREPDAALTIVALLNSTPATPPRGGRYDGETRSEHVRYAQLVLADSVRRQVRAAGSSLVQHIDEAFSLPAATIGQRVDRLQRGLQAVSARLDELAGRLGVRVSADVGRDPVFAPAGREEHLLHAERALVGGCLINPAVREIATSTLRPEDFGHADTAATFEIILDLHARGEPVDFVFVAAEIERRGGGAAGNGPGLGAADLARLAAGEPGAAWAALEPVLRAALHHVTTAAQHGLTRAVDDRTLTATEVVQRAHAALLRGRRGVARLATDDTRDWASRPAAPSMGRASAARRP